MLFILWHFRNWSHYGRKFDNSGCASLKYFIIVINFPVSDLKVNSFHKESVKLFLNVLWNGSLQDHLHYGENRDKLVGFKEEKNLKRTNLSVKTQF
jgi:hypothetical protein